MQDQPLVPPRRTRFIDVLEAGVRAGRRLGLVDPACWNREALLEQVAEEYGLDDFGDDWFTRPLDVVLDSARAEAGLNAAGELSGMKTIHHLLRDRLYAQMWFKRHPEILARPIRNPVVIVGPMRSGTTRLHRLLASDDRFAHLRSFETISPVPRPDFEEVLAGHREDFRPVLAKRILKVARLANPRTLSIHPTGPYEPEEELGLIAASFYGMKFEAQWRVPTFARWCEGESAVPAYRHMANLLRLIGWSQEESSLRPWVLKTPQHMLDLPALLEVFPDARLIFTHRDPQSIVGSAASLAWNQTIIYADDVNPQTIGREWLRKTNLMVSRMSEFRKDLPAAQAIDIHFDEMDNDWRSAMERVYQFLGLDIEPALQGMAAYLDRTAASKRTLHTYSLAEFGLRSGEVQERFAPYIEAFGVSTAGASIRKLAVSVSG
ncbi:sulfotransferase [Qipengyuania flava]|nr:sulfotransferase [Qipengyuania flava]